METRGITNRGNPEDYWLVLECGHLVLRSHSAREMINMALYGLAKVKGDDEMLPHTFCHKCRQEQEETEKNKSNVGKKLQDFNLKWIKDYVPQEIIAKYKLLEHEA